MKANNKYLVFVVGAFIALSSCQQDESLTQRPQGDASVITFNSPYTVDSRSDAMRSGSFKTGDKVGVLGYCKASNQGTDYSTSPWDTKKPFSTPDVFYNQELTYSGTGSWDYSWSGTFDGEGPVGKLHPWSQNENDTFSFFAYYPYAENGTITIDGINMGEIELSASNHRGDPTITYTMPFSGGNATSQSDWRRIPDFMLAYKTNHKRRDGSVNLNFRHLFCAFEFEINNYNEFPVIVSDLYVRGGNRETQEGFYKSVTVVGQESGYSVGNDVYIGEFQLIGGASTDGIRCEAAQWNADKTELTPTTMFVTVDHTAQGEPISLLFIPNEYGKITNDNNESVELEVRITAADDSGFDFERVAPMNLETSTFQPGVRSIFSINIIGNDFYIQMRSDGSWEDEGDSDIVFE